MAAPAPPTPTPEEMSAFARRYGLDKLTPEHVVRMTELAVHVANLGRTLPRPPAKEDGPAPTFAPQIEPGS